MPPTEAYVRAIGTTGMLRHQPLNGMQLTVDAFRECLADGGVAKSEIDGVIVNMGSPSGPDYDELCRVLGIESTYSLQTWAHGRFSGPVLALASLLVTARVCRNVLCVYGYHLESGRIGSEDWKSWNAQFRDGGGPHGERPVHGYVAPVGSAAMAGRRYMERYGVDPELLYWIAHTFRTHAKDNPRALFRKPIGEAEYRDAPWVVEPLRRLDCAPVTEGAACMIVSGRDDVAGNGRPLVRVAGFMGLPAGREQFIWAPPGLGVETQSERPVIDDRVDAMYDSCGVAREDIGAFYTYDAFSPLVWFALERFGFCDEGQAPAFVMSGALSRDGALPTNTHGGMLSEGHLSGWGHLLEMVRQLRGEAETRQLGGLEHAQWGSCFGDSLIMTREEAHG